MGNGFLGEEWYGTPRDISIARVGDKDWLTDKQNLRLSQGKSFRSGTSLGKLLKEASEIRRRVAKIYSQGALTFPTVAQHLSSVRMVA